jgi:hypothetical protein
MIRFNFLIYVKMPCGQTRQPTSSSTLSTSSTQRPTGNNLFNGLMGWLNNYIGQGTNNSGSTQQIQSNQSTTGSSSQRRRSTQAYSNRPTRRRYDGAEAPQTPQTPRRGRQEWRVPPNYDDYGFDGSEGSDGQEGQEGQVGRRQLNLSDSERARRRQRAKSMPRDPATGRFISPVRRR